MDSDSDYDDIGFIPETRNNTVNDNHARKAPHRNAIGKTTRGGDRMWTLLKSFDTAEEYLQSDLYTKVKAEFVKMRNRQFDYALVEEHRCKYGKKAGYLPCPFALRVMYPSSDQSVRVETDAEHLHELDPLYGHQEGVSEKNRYKWTPTMTAIVTNTIVSNKGKPLWALKNMREAQCFDHLHPEPSMEQLYNKVAAVKKSATQHQKMKTTHDMRQVVNNHLEVPIDDNEAFIPYYDIDDEDPTKLRFTIIFASNRSISRCVFII